MKTPRTLAAFVFSVATLVAPFAHAQLQLENAVMLQGFGEQDTPELFHETGYRLEQKEVRSSFVLGPLAQKIFAQHAPLRANMPASTPNGFLPLVQDISNFILAQEKERASSAEQKNGIKNWALAVRIVRLAFCFGTDPRGVAAQIQVESSFDRTRVSSTGAVGFTQMTSAAIDEVNDQLGNRGINGTRLENVPYFEQAIRCYMGGRAFVPMFADGTIARGKLVLKDVKARNTAKAWLRVSVDRELIYGQITLKTLLAVAYSHGLTGEAAYRDAFRRYNGEPGAGARNYSREVFSTMKGPI